MVEYEPELDLTFKALGDRSRRSILAVLACGPRTVTELAEPLDMSLAGASKHIQVLVEAGLVRQERRGRKRLCSLETKRLREAESWINKHSTFWNQRLDALQELLEKDQEP